MLSKLTIQTIALAKLLAVMRLTLGYAFIYQGQEISMVNQQFQSISELRDIEAQFVS